jgi:hypothetical protein
MPFLKIPLKWWNGLGSLKLEDLGIGFQKCPMLCNALLKNSFEVVERFRFLKIGRPWKFAFKNMLCSVMLYVFEG